MRDFLGRVEEATPGDPERPVLWVSKSLDNLAAALCAMGHRVSRKTVGRLLRRLGFSRQDNFKADESRDHPDRDAEMATLDIHGDEFHPESNYTFKPRKQDRAVILARALTFARKQQARQAVPKRLSPVRMMQRIRQHIDIRVETPLPVRILNAIHPMPKSCIFTI